MNDIELKIEKKRAELNNLTLSDGFTEEHIILSTELDVLLNQYYASQKRVAK